VFDEKRYFQQGRRIRAFNSKLGRFGVLICNDARHPGLAHILAVDGAQFIIVQSAIPARGHPTGDKPAPARYFETGHRHYASTYGVYVIFSNLAGYEEGLLFCGNSMVMAPGGAVLKEAPLFEEAMITASLSQEEIKRFRMTSPLLGEENIDILMDELKRIKKQRIQGQ
jgi:predicted amidohydrolase